MKTRPVDMSSFESLDRFPRRTEEQRAAPHEELWDDVIDESVQGPLRPLQAEAQTERRPVDPERLRRLQEKMSSITHEETWDDLTSDAPEPPETT